MKSTPFSRSNSFSQPQPPCCRQEEATTQASLRVVRHEESSEKHRVTEHDVRNILGKSHEVTATARKQHNSGGTAARGNK